MALDLDTQEWLAEQFAAHGRPDVGHMISDYSDKHEVWAQVLTEARRGDVLDAITTAERMLHPKFWHRGQARLAYESVMAANDNKEAAKAVA